MIAPLEENWPKQRRKNFSRPRLSIALEFMWKVFITMETLPVKTLEFGQKKATGLKGSRRCVVEPKSERV